MFSEYASRFLAQSQSRLSNFRPPDSNSNNDGPSRQPTDMAGRGSRFGGRSFMARNPYAPSTSRFGHLTTAFGSRYATPQEAPLFHNALDDEEEEEEERRDAADLFALQRSRRVLAASRLEESSEIENDASHPSLRGSQEKKYRYSGSFGDRRPGMGIRSSWNGTRSGERHASPGQHANEEAEVLDRQNSHESDESKGKMSEIGLESEYTSNDPPAELTVETPLDDNNPPAFQKFNTPPVQAPGLPRHSSTQETDMDITQPPSSAASTSLVPATGVVPESDLFRFDPFFAWIYLIALASLLATFVLIYLHTSGKNPVGDTIYTVLRASFNLLAVDTLVSIIVSLVWLAALRSFVRPLVGLILVAVPVILISFTLYPMISSYQGRKHGSSLQDWVMRWASIVPGIAAAVWIYLVYQGRHAISSAIKILEFSSRILAENPALVLVGLGSLASVVIWTWAWLAMFTRIFLGGEFSNALSRWIINASSWWLGAYFVLMYIWTLSIVSGVQRATTAATVSQWYFHRNASPQIPSPVIVSAALRFSLTTVFGSVSLATLLSLGVRLPLLLLPRRLGGLINLFAATFVPTPVTALTNPLSITYAAIHSEPLVQAARNLGRLDFLGPDATSTLTPRVFNARRSAYGPLLPYRLAKLLLFATRFIMATALGFAGWVITARQLRITLPDGMGLKGSAYAYVVGLVASFIGWGILGSMEGILSGIVDATVICYGTEKRMANGGYCMEAAYLFGDRRGVEDEEAIY